MSNKLKHGFDSAPVPNRHGRTGEIQLSVGIHPELKDRLVVLALDRHRPLKELVATAITNYLKAEE